MKPTELPQWQELKTLAGKRQARHLATDFQEDDDRFSKFSYRSERLLVDLSKQPINEEVVATLLSLSKTANLNSWIEKLFSGEKVNNYENRPALHMALRAPKGQELFADEQNINADVHANLDKMESLVNQVQQRQWRGYSGLPIDTIVNIGVGGSDLGPQMACRALEEFEYCPENPLSIHFVSSMDGSQLSQLLSQLNPKTTLFVLSSKSFSTVDTLANANTARQWLGEHAYCDELILLRHHFIGISCKPDKMSEWGIPSENQLALWDWVGGRYSLWSAIGFAIAARIGMSGFRAMLRGAHRMDQHFRTAAPEQNLPTLLALTEIWNINFLDIHAHAVLPYDGRLMYLPPYLEQLEMESNGKNVTRSGEPVEQSTCPIIWGAVGPNAQHAFYQLLHQGTEVVMCDFIAQSRRPADADNQALAEQHDLTLANFLAQSRILALGDSVLSGSEHAPAHKRYKGNQPCTTILMDELDPESFGELIALYEHKVFVQSVIWDINPFDQWGVELGKTVSTELLQILSGEKNTQGLDSSSKGLIAAIAESRSKDR